MIEGTAKQIQEDRKFRDRLTATQTAKLINAQFGTKENPTPAKPDNCMAFDWTEDGEKGEEKGEEPKASEELMRIMNGHIAVREKNYG